MRTIIAGYRGIGDYYLIENAVEQCGWKITVVISGGQRRQNWNTGKPEGVDYLGELWAVRNGVPCEVYPANWEKFNKSAGAIRNRQMAKVADALIALPTKKSKGTRDMINVMRKLGKKVFVLEVE